MHDPILPKKFNSRNLGVDPMYWMKPLSCPCFVTTKGCQEKIPGKELPYFFDQMVDYSLHVSVWRHFFHWKARRDQWRLDKVYVQTILRWLLDAGSSTRNLSVLLSAMEKSCVTRTALALARNHCQNYSHTCACATCCCGYWDLVEEIRYHHHYGVCKTFVVAAAAIVVGWQCMI